MSLRITFDCWNGSCGSFNQWRYYLAKLAGYEMIPIDNKYCSVKEEPKLDWDSYTKKNIKGIWETTPSDPLIVLLYHGDNEGKICVPQLKPLQERLRQILPLIEENDWYHRELTNQFIDGLQQAIDARKAVKFS